MDRIGKKKVSERKGRRRNLCLVVFVLFSAVGHHTVVLISLSCIQINYSVLKISSLVSTLL